MDHGKVHRREGNAWWREADDRDLAQAAKKSCDELDTMGPQVQWIEGFVTDDTIYGVYTAPDAEAIREHAKSTGFPADRMSQVRHMIDPTLAITPMMAA